MRQLVQLKFLNCNLYYTKEEQETIRQWFTQLQEQKQLSGLHTFFEKHILPYREYELKMYEGSDLEALFDEFKIT